MADSLDYEAGPDATILSQPPLPRSPHPDPFATAQTPDYLKTAGASFRLRSPIASVLDLLADQPGNERSPGYDPFDTLKGTPHEGDDFSIYAGSHNEGYTRFLMAKHDQETADRERIAGAGWAGVAMSVGMGLFDPTILLPIVGYERAVGATAKGLAVAASSGAAVGISEAILHQTQVTRTFEESAGNVGSAVILGGVLGSAIAHMSPGEIASATKALDNIRPRVDAETGDAIEHVRSAAVRAPNGQVFEAPNHVLALEKAEAAGHDVFDMTIGTLDEAGNRVPPPDSGGFVTSTGRYVSREEASRMTGIEGNKITESLEPPAPSGQMFASTGAAATDTRQLEPESSFGLGWLAAKARAAPEHVIYNASSTEAKRALRDTASSGQHFKDEGEGQIAPFGAPLENQKLVLTNQAIRNTDKIVTDAWKEYYHGDKQLGRTRTAFSKEFSKTTEEKLGFGDFDRAVGKVMNFGDVSEIPAVQEAAQKLRAQVADPITKFAQETTDRDGKPMLGSELDAPLGAQSFFPLMTIRKAIIDKRPAVVKEFADSLEQWQTVKAAAQARIADLHARYEAIGAEGDRTALRAKIEEEIAGWQGNTTKEAKAALKARDAALAKGSKEGTKPAEDAVDLAVKRILESDRNRSREDHVSRANQWANHLIGSPDGRLAYDEAPTGTGFTGKDDARGSLRERKMPIEVSKLIDLGIVETSATQGMATLARTIIPDALLTRRFGDRKMTDIMRRIEEEYDAKIEAAPAAAKKLNNERDRVVANLAAVRDRLRGVYGWDSSWESRRYGAMVRDLQHINIIRALGTAGFNSMTDLSNGVIRYGFENVLRDSWGAYFQALINPELRNIIREQAADAGVGIEGMLGQMMHNFFEVSQAYAPGNKFSRGLAWFSDKSMILNLNGWVTDTGKQLAFNVAQGELGRATARFVAGKATKRDLARFDELAIDGSMATRISEQYEKHAIDAYGRKFANQANWDDRGARMAFESAMTREANISVVTPGIGDKPVLMDQNFWKIVLQFQSFNAAALSKILISSLQKRDARVMQGLVASVAMGLLSTAMYKIVSGQPMSSDPRDWLKESLDRTAMPSWIGVANNHLSALTKGTLDYNRLYGANMPLTRHRDRSLLGELGGPTVDLAEKLARAAEHAIGRTPDGDSEFSGSDVHALRTGMALQNWWAARRGFDAIERGIDEHFGFKPAPSIVRQP